MTFGQNSWFGTLPSYMQLLRPRHFAFAFLQRMWLLRSKFEGATLLFTRLSWRTHICSSNLHQMPGCWFKISSPHPKLFHSCLFLTCQSKVPDTEVSNPHECLAPRWTTILLSRCIPSLPTPYPRKLHPTTVKDNGLRWYGLSFGKKIDTLKEQHFVCLFYKNTAVPKIHQVYSMSQILISVPSQ